MGTDNWLPCLHIGKGNPPAVYESLTFYWPNGSRYQALGDLF